jgi:hypothetical protein
MINSNRHHFLRIIVGMMLFTTVSKSQSIQFASIQAQDKSNIEFEIIGKQAGSYLIYKNISKKHCLSSYDSKMQHIESVPLNFLPEKLFNIDFVKTANNIIAVFQEQKNNQVYCGAVRMDAKGVQLGAVVYLDTAQIGYFANNRIYSLAVSEDKTKCLIYRKQIRNDEVEMNAKIFDTALSVLDAFEYEDLYANRKDEITALSISNEGTVLFCHEYRKYAGDHFNRTTLLWHRLGENGVNTSDLPLQAFFTMGAYIKIDNYNKRAMITTFYLGEKDDQPRGLFCLRFDLNLCQLGQSRFNELTGDLAAQLKSDNNRRSTWKSLLPNQLLFRKDGSFLMLSESFFTQTWNGNNGWNQNGFLSNPMMNPYNDFGFYNPYYSNYRPWGFNNNPQTRFYYNDIISLSVDSLLQLEWTTSLNKSQMDVDNDHFLSFGFLNAGAALHFFYLNPEKQKSALLHQGLTPDGIFQNQPTFFGAEERYSFMPRLSKQVGARQLLIPFQYQGKIGFARIDL